MKRPGSIDDLDRVDFSDPLVVAAIKKAADSFDERKYQDRLEQFETPVHESAWQQVYP